MTLDYDVIVVGAGVGGAALALGLAHAWPLRVLVVERQAGPGKVNRGDSLLPAVTAQLAAWGALERFVAAGARPLERMQVFHHRAGLLLETRFDELPLRHPYLVLPHADIERVLAEAAEATGRVEIRYRSTVARLIEEGGRVRGVAAPREGGGETILRARLVVGADGSSSLVRAALGVPFVKKPYDHSFFVIELERPAAYRDAMRIELHPKGGVLIVPHPSGARIGLGVLVQPDEQDLFRAAPIEARLAAIRRRSPLLTDCRRPFPGFHLYRLSRAHAERYTARGAALIGDAAHVTNPTAGQGMTMAIEDAAALARHAGPVLAAGDNDVDLDRALLAYETERRPLNAGLVRWSHWMSRFYAWPGAFGDWLRRGVFSLGGSPLGRWLQRSIWARVAARPELQGAR